MLCYATLLYAMLCYAIRNYIYVYIYIYIYIYIYKWHDLGKHKFPPTHATLKGLT